jgi:hypothetical protein
VVKTAWCKDCGWREGGGKVILLRPVTTKRNSCTIRKSLFYTVVFARKQGDEIAPHTLSAYEHYGKCYAPIAGCSERPTVVTPLRPKTAADTGKPTLTGQLRGYSDLRPAPLQYTDVTPSGGTIKLLSNTGFTLDSFVDVLAERIAQKMGDKNGVTKTAIKKRLLTTDEPAEFLGRTREAMQHLAASGTIPTVRSDRRVFFDLHDLERWIDRNKQKGMN